MSLFQKMLNNGEDLQRRPRKHFISKKSHKRIKIFKRLVVEYDYSNKPLAGRVIKDLLNQSGISYQTFMEQSGIGGDKTRENIFKDEPIHLETYKKIIKNIPEFAGLSFITTTLGKPPTQ